MLKKKSFLIFAPPWKIKFFEEPEGGIIRQGFSARIGGLGRHESQQKMGVYGVLRGGRGLRERTKGGGGNGEKE